MTDFFDTFDSDDMPDEPRITEAHYHTRCAYCGEHISPGDLIAYSHDDDGFVHEDCL